LLSPILSNAVKNELANSKRELSRNLEQANSERLSAFEHGLKIASVGSIKGVWSEFSNPIRDALVQDLKRLAVVSPEQVVDRAFSEHGSAYLKMILSKAQELAEKSDDIRNETARLVRDAKPAIGVGIAAQVSDMLSRGGTIIENPTKETASSDTRSKGTFSDRIASIVKTL
jgi:hypothetical protein